jgi:phage terminase large subunit GpA-like protein
MTRRGKNGLAAWIEKTIELPQGLSAEPGPVRLWPWQIEIADAITDPTVERVTLVKPVRVGFTSLLTSALAWYVVREPAPILCLLPTEADCRDYMVSDVEATFDSSPALHGLLSTPKRGSDRINRNTLCHRIFTGGSLKIVAGKAPRNLRRHTARILCVDEADAIETSGEGDPIMLAERRTLSFANRKIIVGSTPLQEDTSHVMRCYGESDQRIFELPCPSCGAFTEILWQHIEWPQGPPEQPEAAAFRCPHCRALVEERHKPAMVKRGRWRALRPEVARPEGAGHRGHRGYRLNALVSLLANASWGRLAAEYLRAKDADDTLKAFTNTILAQPWRSAGDELDDMALARRVEPFSLSSIPADVLVVTLGVDVQGDRLEVSIVGWGKDGTGFVLAHESLWGPPDGEEVWQSLDELLRQRWQHPHGGQLRADAAAIDAGAGAHYDRVLDFCAPRLGRKVFAIKGVPGFARPAITRTRMKKGKPLFLAGVDAIKAGLFAKLARGDGIRFGDRLPPEYFEMLVSERRVIRRVRGKPVQRFERIPGKRAESLDALVYATAAKAGLALSPAAFSQRADELASPAPPPPRQTLFPSSWMEQGSGPW